MLRIGITGQSGFMGSHLFNYLSLKKNEVELISFEDNYFTNENLLENFVRQCDVIIHLAAMNRHQDPKVIYDTNIGLVTRLISILEKNELTPHIIFSSSTQEEKNNIYGKSKKEGRLLFEQWAKKNRATFTTLVIPNVFGPFGRPHFNSVIATFSHQLTHNEEPKIIVDSKLQLIYINDLVEEFWRAVKKELSNKTYYVPFKMEIEVSAVLEMLKKFNEEYFINNIIPKLQNDFEVDLFNTFRSYIELESHYPFFLMKNTDDRGYLVETIKEHTGGQAFFSITKPGITRGNHFHTRKIERFCVLQGDAEIGFRKIGTEKIITFKVSGENPATIDMPIWYTHKITNTGNQDLLTLFWCNEIFNPKDSDTYQETV